MNHCKLDFKKTFTDILEEQSKDHDTLSQEELVQWRSEGLDEDERREMQKRLLLDREGVRTLLDSTNHQPDAEKSWLKLESRLTALSDNENRDIPFPQPQKSQHFLFRAFPGVMIAALLLIAILLVLQVRNLQQERLFLMAPSLNTSVQLIAIGDPATRSEPLSSTFLKGNILLQLRISNHLGDYPVWRVSLLDPNGTSIFNGEAPLDDFRMLNLSLTHDYFTVPGEYRIDVMPLDNETPVNFSSAFFIIGF